MLPIVIASLVALAIVIERWFALQPNRVAPPAMLAQVWVWLKGDKIDADKIRTLRASAPLGQILATGLSNAHLGRDVMKQSIEEAAGKVTHDLEKYLDVIGTIAVISPLLGLLGTVVGMIDVFAQIVQVGAGDATALAGGISQALYTTAAGIFVAVPAVMAHRYYLRKVDGIVVAMEQETIKLVDALHSGRSVRMASDLAEKEATVSEPDEAAESEAEPSEADLADKDESADEKATS